jgi:PAS domain S-box-containing protein
MTAAPTYDASPSESASAAPPADAARRQLALVEVGRRMNAVATPEALLRDAAALLAETLGADHFGMALRDSESDGLPCWLWETGDRAASLTDHRESGPAGEKHSLAGYAMARRQTTVSSDLAREKRFRDSRLLERGLRSGMAVPLLVEEEAVGALGVFSLRPRALRDDDPLFAESIAHLLGLTLARRQVERELAEHQRRQEVLLDGIDAIVLELDPRARARSLNQTGRRLTGFTAEDLRHRPLWAALLPSEDAGAFQEAFERVLRGETPVEVHSRLIAKDGRRRDVAWSLSATAAADGGVESLLATGIETTELRQAREELDRTLGAAHRAQHALRQLRGRFAGTTAAFDDCAFEALLDEGVRDRRAAPRRAYPYVQRLAPMADEQVPASAAFREITCYDISSGGFSFLSRLPIQHERFVVAFGAEPSLTHIIAEVVHQKPVQVDGVEQHLIGCRYLGKPKDREKQGAAEK